MPVGPQTIIENPLNRKSIFSKFDYTLTPKVTAYGQVLYVDSDVYTSSGRSLTQIGTLTTIPVTNPFIPADLQTILASRPDPTAPFTWNGRYVGLPNKAWDEHYTTSQFLGGLRGDLPFLTGWTWDAYAAYDDTHHLQTNHNAVLKSQVQNLLNAADGGASLCAGGFNPFGLVHSSAISSACQAYMTTTAHSSETLTQSQAQATIQGPVFHLPAGDMHVALLVDTRRNTYDYTPDAQLSAGNIEAVAVSHATRGTIGVNEFAGQVDIPVLRDLPLISQLDVGAAYRYSDYTTSGGVGSYEGDVRWRPINSLLVRGGYQHAVRAPNVGELFSAANGTQVAIGTPPASIGDPCDIRSTARTGANGAKVRALCVAQGVPASVVDTYTFPTTATGGLTQGNPDLKPEVATTYNVGLAWTSHLSMPLLGNMSASIDYYDISIEKVISVIPGLTALSKCFNLDGSNPTYSNTNTFCQLIPRDANGLITQINTPYLNLGGLKTDGIDIQLNWSARLADFGVDKIPGKVFASTGIGYLNHFLVQTLPNSRTQDFAGTNTINGGAGALGTVFPRWKALTTLGYQNGGATVGLRWRYMDGMKDVSSVTSPGTHAEGVPAYNLFDLYGSYEISRKWQIRAGITNLFDTGLPVVASSQTSTDPATFDAVGRSYYLGLRATF